MRFLLALACWMVVWLPAGPPVRAEERCMTVAMIAEQAIDTVQRPAVEHLYREAGLCVKPVSMMLQRSQELLLRGRIDAELGRTRILADRYIGQVAVVPTPLAMLEVLAIWLEGAAPEPEGFSSLRGHRVASSMGTAWAQDVAQKNGANGILLNRLEAMEGVLAHGRVEYVLLEDIRDRELWPQLLKSDLKVRHKTIGKLYFYHVLAKKNADLVPRLDAAIKRLGGPGFLNAYMARMRSVYTGDEADRYTGRQADTQADPQADTQADPQEDSGADSGAEAPKP